MYTAISLFSGIGAIDLAFAPRVRAMFRWLRKQGVFPREARLIEYAGGYVALRLTVAQTHVLVMACGLTMTEAA